MEETFRSERLSPGCSGCSSRLTQPGVPLAAAPPPLSFQPPVLPGAGCGRGGHCPRQAERHRLSGPGPSPAAPAGPGLGLRAQAHGSAPALPARFTRRRGGAPIQEGTWASDRAAGGEAHGNPGEWLSQRDSFYSGSSFQHFLPRSHRTAVPGPPSRVPQNPGSWTQTGRC